MESQERKRFVDQAKKVKFKVLKLEDLPKYGSEVCTGALLEGHLINNRVYYTDCENYMWIFYVGDTCEILNQ